MAVEVPITLASEEARQKYEGFNINDVPIKAERVDDPVDDKKIKGSKYETPDPNHRDLGLLKFAKEQNVGTEDFQDISDTDEGTAFIEKQKLFGEGLKIALETRATALKKLQDEVKRRGDTPLGSSDIF